MPLTPADKQQVDSYLKNNQPHLAKVLLERHLKDEPFDESARKVLGKIKARYPEPTTPPPAFTAPAPKSITQPVAAIKPVMAQLPAALRLDADDGGIEVIKQAIREKRYDDAEALLVLSDHPDADKLRQRLAEIRGKPRTSAPQKPKQPISTGSMIRRVVLVVLIIGIVAMIANMVSDSQRRNAELTRDYGIKRALNDVCFEVYWEEYFDAWGAARFNAACEKEIQFMRTIYTETVDRCYDAWGKETTMLIRCLGDGGASFAGGYMRTGDDS